MPHLIYQHSDNLSQYFNKPFFIKNHQYLAEILGININLCRSRSVVVNTYCIGDSNTIDAMLYLQVRLLHGHSSNTLNSIGHLLAREVKNQLSRNSIQQPISATIEIVEIAPAFYYKVPELEETGSAIV